MGRDLRFVGQRGSASPGDTYTHVLLDGQELDYAALLDRSA